MTSLPTVADLASADELLDRIESEVPVEDWRVADLRVWPIARIRIGHALHAATQRRPARPWGVRASTRSVLLRVAASAVAAPTAVQGLRRLGRADALAVSDGVSWVDAGGSSVDRQLDPVRAALGPDRVPMLLPGPAPASPTVGPVVRVGPLFDVAATLARVRRKERVSTPGREQAVRLLDDVALGDVVPGPHDLATAAGCIELWAAMLGDVLRRTGARAVFVSEWYGLRGMAAVLAGRRAGVPAVDVQHGVQGVHHFAYRPWRAAPATTRDLMPDWFWVWDRDDAEALLWTEGTGHRVVVGGHPFLGWWNSGSVPGQLDCDADLAIALGQFTPSRSVLVGLTGNEPTSRSAAAIADLVRAAPEDWWWWIRAHPVSGDAAALSAALDAALEPWARARTEVRAATRLPLPAVLARSDVLVTTFSSAVLEAVRCGVPSVVTDPLGAELFGAPHGRTGVRLALGGPGDVVAAIRSVGGQGKGSPAATGPGGPPAAPGFGWARRLVGNFSA